MPTHHLTKSILFFIASFLQGVNLVMYPSAATLLTNPHYHDLTAHEYGSLFIPFIIAALLISYFGGKFEEKQGHRSVFVFALLLNGLSVLIFTITAATFGNEMLSYILLLIALFCLGLGFGSMLTILTPYMLALFPKYAHTATLAIYGILCLGASLSPLYFHAFTAIGVWWIDPLLVTLLFMLLLYTAYRLLPSQKEEGTLFSHEKLMASSSAPLPLLFWGFFLFMFLYGLTSTVYANWITIYMHTALKFSTYISSQALSLFWGFMLIGRVIMVGGAKWIPPKLSYIITPPLMLLSYVLVPFIHSALGNLTLFAFAGLAFSASFPLTFSFAGQTFPQRASLVSGRITAAYILGYGIAAYGVGYLYDILEIPLKEIFFYTWTLALVMCLLSLYLIQNKKIA